MNQRCLYCYQTLREDQKDFHEECATLLFGCTTAPTHPFEATLADQFYLSESANDEGYIPELQSVVMRMAQGALILTQDNTLILNSDSKLQHITKVDSSTESIEQLIARLDGCSFDGTAEMIAELIEDFSSISRLDVVSYFEQLIFAWVTGCNSISPRSFGLTRPNAGVCSLAAISNFTPTLSDAGMEFGVEVNGKRRNIRRSDFEAAMKFMGLKDRIIRITIEKMTKSKEKWGEIIDSSHLDEKSKQEYFAQISAKLSILER
ncbi:MAG: hypothetical protein SNG49_04970 [Rikenellaceae bacterium]